MTTAHEDAEAVRLVVASLTHYIDARRWDDLLPLFTSEVRTDYTSLFGGAPQQQSREALVGGWRDSLGAVATQHLLGPIVLRVTDGDAGASCHVRAFHHAPGTAGGDTWEVLGHYELAIKRSAQVWEIAALTLQTYVQTGNEAARGGESLNWRTAHVGCATPPLRRPEQRSLDANPLRF